MKPQFYTLCLLSVVCLMSCDQSLPRTEAIASTNNLPQLAGKQPVVAINPTPSLATPAAAASKLNPAHGLPGHRCDIAVGAPLNGAAAFSTTLPASAVSGMPLQKLSINTPAGFVPPATVIASVNNQSSAANPAHGLPGHRCDIPVGAPLNSPPGKQVAIAQPQPAAITAKGLNPKHGEPGHRCDIPVGASLSLPIAKPNQAAVTSQPSQAGPVTVSPALNNSQPAFVPADGLNPKHGEPGHRCDIAIGAPLATKN